MGQNSFKKKKILSNNSSFDIITIHGKIIICNKDKNIILVKEGILKLIYIQHLKIYILNLKMETGKGIKSKIIIIFFAV